MNKLLKTIGWVLILSVLTFTKVFAETTGDFPGVDELIEQADTIAIVRIENKRGKIMMDLHGEFDCYVYTSLKGSLKQGDRVSLMLHNNHDVTRLPFSTVLVFLKDKRTLNYEGSQINVSEVGNENIDTNRNIKENIIMLIERYKKYRSNILEKEDRILEKVGTKK